MNHIKKVASITTPDAKIIFTEQPYVQYEQFKLNNNFKQYIKTIMTWSKLLRIRIQKTPLQKMYEMAIGAQSFNKDFLSCQQIVWLVRNFSNLRQKQQARYNLQHLKCWKSFNFYKFVKARKHFNQMKYDVTNKTHKHLLYRFY